jgi:hypothetical protein
MLWARESRSRNPISPLKSPPLPGRGNEHLRAPVEVLSAFSKAVLLGNALNSKE